MHVILHPRAESELLEAVRFYEDRAPGLGKDLLQDFQRAVDRIRDNPESGVKMGQLVRRLLLRRFPFSILYRTSGDELRLLAVMHHRRRPGYWKGRR